MHTHSLPPAPPRRPYRAARVETYGDLRALTLVSGGNAGINDTGGGNDETAFV